MGNGPFLVKVSPISYIIFTCSENIVDLFESLSTYACTMYTSLLRGHLGPFITFKNIILTITNATSKKIHSSDQNIFQISGATSYVMTYILSPE